MIKHMHILNQLEHKLRGEVSHRGPQNTKLQENLIWLGNKASQLGIQDNISFLLFSSTVNNLSIRIRRSVRPPVTSYLLLLSAHQYLSTHPGHSMAIQPSCSESFLSDIARLVNTSGILLANNTSQQEKRTLLRDFVNNSLHGKKYKNGRTAWADMEFYIQIQRA